MPMKTIHCRLCGKAISGETFPERMAKLRRHRKKYHPTAHKESVKKTLKTKGILDPKIIQRSLRKITDVTTYKDYNASGMIRVLDRSRHHAFPELALSMKKWDQLLVKSLIEAGFRKESRGKWVLRTNHFSLFVYE